MGQIIVCMVYTYCIIPILSTCIDKLDFDNRNKQDVFDFNDYAGADPGFQVRGGGAHLKKCAEQREARKFWGYFV
jgi:hypothetical protein